MRALGAMLLSALLLSACVTSQRAFTRALSDWRIGHRASAVAAAREEYERWRDGNDLGDAEIEGALAEVDRVLHDDVPLVVPGDAAPPPPPGAPTRPGQATVLEQLRRDLLSTGTTIVIRALTVVDRLALERLGPEALTVVFRREPFEADGVLLATASPALRSLVVKRVALRALETLAALKTAVL